MRFRIADAKLNRGGQMKNRLLLTISTVLIGGYAKTIPCGDFRMIFSPKFVPGAFSFISPEFPIGNKNAFVFDAIEMKCPVIPQQIYFSPSKGDPSSLDGCVIEIVYEDLTLNTKEKTTVKMPKNGTDWDDMSKTLWEDNNRGKCGVPPAKRNFRIRINVLSPSKSIGDRAYLRGFFLPSKAVENHH